MVDLICRDPTPSEAILDDCRGDRGIQSAGPNTLQYSNASAAMKAELDGAHVIIKHQANELEQAEKLLGEQSKAKEAMDNVLASSQETTREQLFELDSLRAALDQEKARVEAILKFPTRTIKSWRHKSRISRKNLSRERTPIARIWRWQKVA